MNLQELEKEAREELEVEKKDIAKDILKSRIVEIGKAEKMLKSATDTAEKAGKVKATKKDLQGVKEKSVNWKKYGILCYNKLNEIYELPISKRRDHLDNLIASAGDLLSEVEDQMGKVGL